MRLRELAEQLGAELRGADVEINGIAALGSATPSDIVYAESQQFAAEALDSKAGAVITIPKAIEGLELKGRSILVVRDARLGFARAASLLRSQKRRSTGVHPTASVDPSVTIPDSSSVGAQAYLGPGTVIGERTVIGPGCMLLGDCEIGVDCELVARVTVYPKTMIGNRVTIHAGAVLGSDGFGFVRDAESGRYEKFPQVGSLQIGNDVEIGANATIDRGALESTIISDGVKLDNMVHVGHNAQIGENVVIAAQTGVSGSSVLEKNVLVGGQVGIADHVVIGEGAILGAQCGVPSKKVIRGKGVVFWGTPARPIGELLKEMATVSRLARRKKASE